MNLLVVNSAFLLRLVLHIVLLTLLMVKVVDWNFVNADYGRSLRRSFTFLFSPNDAPIPTITSNGVTNLNTQIFTYSDLEFAVDRAVGSYFNLNNISTAQFQYGYRQQHKYQKSCSSTPSPILLETVQWTNPHHFEVYDSWIYSPDNFSASSVLIHNRTEFFSRLDTLRMKFDVCNIDNANTNQINSNKCNYWHVIVEYKSMGQMFLDTIVTARLEESCSDDKSHHTNFRYVTTAIDLVCILFATAYIVFVFKDIRYSLKIYNEIRAAHKSARNRYLFRDLMRLPNAQAGLSAPNDLSDLLHGQSALDPGIAALYDWDEIPLGVKRSFHPYWSILTCCGLLLTLVESWMSLLLREDRFINLSVEGKLLLGGCSMLLWVALLQFLVVFPSLYAIGSTLQTVLTRMLSFFVGFIPLFLGFVVLGVVLFGAHMGMFASFQQAAWGLFSFMNGDSVQPIILLMTTRSYATGIVFAVMFLLIMAYLMLNILIAIVEEAYFLARRHDRNLESIMWRNLETIAMETLPPDASTQQSFPAKPPPHATRGADDGDGSDDGEDLGEEDQSEASNNIDWIQGMFGQNYNADSQFFSSDPLLITLAEETAETYILGRSHYEYSKMMDYLVEHLS